MEFVTTTQAAELCVKHGIQLEILDTMVIANYADNAYIMYIVTGVTKTGRYSCKCSQVVGGQTVYSWWCAVTDPVMVCVKAAVKEVRYAQQL